MFNRVKKQVILLVALTTLSTGCGVKNFQKTSNFSPATSNSETQNYQTVEKKPQIKNDLYNAKDNSYAYNGVLLSYLVNSANNHQVDVYINKNNKNKLLIKGVVRDIPGDSYPQFYATENPNIALLNASTGDAGSNFENFYFISIDNEHVTNIQIINNSLIEVSSLVPSGPKTELSLSYSQVCPIENDGLKRDSRLTGITIDSKQAVRLESENLNCLFPGGVGPVSDPYFDLYITGINENLTTIFFNLRKFSVSDENNINKLEEKPYSFNFIEKKVIQVEQPKKVLYNFPRENH